jgi:hypothetical protein
MHMSQDSEMLYGGLVATPHQEEQPQFVHEESAMKEQTRFLIEQAAYFLAEKRGFAPGYELEDWLQAEAQISK